MKQARKFPRKAVLAVLALAALLYTVPLLTAFYLCTGLIDVLRNTRQRRDGVRALLSRQWHPDLAAVAVQPADRPLCYRQPRDSRLEDLPPAWRSEVETVLDTFKARKAEIIGDVDRVFEAGRRGMYVFKWYGKENDHSIGEFKRPFTYMHTIAVSVSSGARGDVVRITGRSG